ncbi:MAG: hypothetical protein HY808_03540, partial [Nitrospirae bacterium]|nr:hypothetical protein [Nitrospirota bacterium]
LNADLKGVCIAYPGDFNGDGKTDLMRACDNPASNYLWLTTPTISDLLSTIFNGIGGATTLEYTPSSVYANNMLPFITQTVSSVTVNDGNGNSSTTNYTYSGGYYDYAEREYRGFGYVKATALYNPGYGVCIDNPDYACTSTETWFKQDSIFKGLPYDQIIRDSSGNIYTRTYNTYQSTTPYTGVKFPYLYQKDDYLYDGTSTAKQARSLFTYDAYGNITRRYSYGDLAVTGDERDEYTEYAYDTTNWKVSLPNHSYVNDSSGTTKAQAWFTYDTKGNLLTKTNWLNGGINPVTTYTYDAYGNVQTIKDPRNNISTITYDTTTRTYPVTMQNPLGHTIQKSYDYRFGKVLTEIDPNLNQATYQYDVFGRIVKVTNPNDTASTYGTVSYYYQNFGTVGSQRVLTYATEQSGTGNIIWSETYFDGLGRTIKTRTEGPDNKVVAARTIFNNRGLVAQESLPYFENLENARYRTYQYDPIGRIIRTDNLYDGTYATSSYLKGRLTYIDPNFHKKVEEKDIYGRTIKIEEYTGVTPSFTLYATTAYEYDVLGNLKKVTDANNNQSTMTYDSLSRKTSMTDPDMGYWTYQYDANGNLISQTDAKSQTITFTYDALNRITLKDYTAGTDVTYAYDETFSTYPKGRLTTVTDASGTTKFYYDKMGRTTKTIKTVDSVNYTTETTYDALGRTDTIKYPDNMIVKYEYDTGGNLLKVKNNSTGLVYAAYTNYNALGQIGRTDFGNGVNTIYQYLTQNNRLYSITTSKQSTGFINLSYAYDNGGNITGITDYLDSTKNRTYGYDALDRLTSATSTSYGGTLTWQYNTIGNMTYNSRYGNYSYNDPAHKHAVTNAGADTYTYDANGNMTGGAGRAFIYNYDNRAISVRYGNKVVVSWYDADGNRFEKNVFPAVGVPTTTTYISKLYECTDGVCTKYIFAGTQRIAKINGAEINYYHTDHLGSSSVITDAAGTKVQEVQYYPFGETLVNNGSVDVSYKFTGQEEDAETGLYYYGARYYDPKLARFVSADTIVPEPFDPQALNRYSYVLNNPVIFTDPSGHYSDDFYCCSGGNGGGDYWGSDPWGQFDSGDSSDEWYDYWGNLGSGNSGGNNQTTPTPTPAPAPAPAPAPKPIPAAQSSYSYTSFNINNINLTGRGWYSGIESYLEDRTDQNVREGNIAAAYIDQIGIEAIDLLLPQSWYDVPLMLMPMGKVGGLSDDILRSLMRFEKKLPAKAGTISIHNLPMGGKAFISEVPGRVLGSKAIYEKQLDVTGKTIGYYKTTIGPDGKIIHVKDKISGKTFLP